VFFFLFSKNILKISSLEARLVGEAKSQLEAEKCELLNELKEKLQNANDKIKSYENRLEEKEKSTTKILENSDEVDRLKREIRRLKQEQQITSGVLDDLEEELRPMVLNPTTMLSRRNLSASILPTNSTPLDLAELQTKVDRANLHLKTLEKDHLVSCCYPLSRFHAICLHNYSTNSHWNYTVSASRMR
jgi:predicted ribosome quality control (RQC) complex YloA/Tae2 family protein